MSVVNTGGEFPGLTLSIGRGMSQGETLPLALQKNSDAITLLKQGSLLTLAVLLSSYGSLKSLVSSLCAFIQNYDAINRMLLLHSRDVLRSDWSCNIFAVGTGQI